MTTFFHSILHKGTRAVNTIYHMSNRYATFNEAADEAYGAVPAGSTNNWLICVYHVENGVGREVTADGSEIIPDGCGRVVVVPCTTVHGFHARLHVAEENAHAAARAVIDATIRMNLAPVGDRDATGDKDNAEWCFRQRLLLLGEAVVLADNARKAEATAAVVDHVGEPTELVVDPCCYCGESTACGNGKFVNRIPSDGGDANGPDVWACEACTSPDLDELLDRAVREHAAALALWSARTWEDAGIAADTRTFARDALDHLLRNNYEFAARCACNAVKLEAEYFGDIGVWTAFAECCIECRDFTGVTAQEETQ
jgi:hypothetical protein